MNTGIYPEIITTPSRSFVNWACRPDLLAEVERMWTLGSSAREIAESLPVRTTRNAIIGIVHRSGWSRPLKITPAAAKVARKPQVKKVGNHHFVQSALEMFEYDEPLRELTDTIPLEQRCRLLELTAKTCRWPIGDPGTADFYFCGALPEPDHPYCLAHGRIAYVSTCRTRAEVEGARRLHRLKFSRVAVDMVLPADPFPDVVEKVAE